MQKVKKLLILLFVICSNPVLAQWNIIDTTGNQLNSLFFTDSLHGYVVGYQTFLQTTDGGNTWKSDTFSPLNWFHKVCFPTKDTGYVIGDAYGGEIILKTINGGINWIVITDSFHTPLYDMSFLSGNYGFVVGDLSYAFKTSDGLIHGTIVSVPSFVGPWASLVQVNQVSMDTIYIIGSPVGGTYELVGSFDGGANWQQLAHVSCALNLDCVNAKTGFIAGCEIIRTNDYFQTDTIITVNEAMLCVHFSSIDSGFVGGYDTAYHASIFRTTDNGNTWVKNNVPPNIGQVTAIFSLSGNLAYAITYDGKILKTTNGGGVYTGVKNVLNQSNISLYPNPATTSLQLTNLPQQKLNYAIINVLGQVKQSGSLAPNNTPAGLPVQAGLNVTPLPAGVYFIRVTGGNGFVGSGKFVKQ